MQSFRSGFINKDVNEPSNTTQLSVNNSIGGCLYSNWLFNIKTEQEGLIDKLHSRKHILCRDITWRAVMVFARYTHHHIK